MFMDSSSAGYRASERSCEFASVFAVLTAKQHEVFALVSDNRSSKEIAGRLGISESAVNQRIEAVRGRAGFPPRAELARAYRSYTAWQQRQEAAVSAPQGELECAFAAGVAPQSPAEGLPPCIESPSALFATEEFGAVRVGPDLFFGGGGKLNRVAAMVVIAVGMLVMAMTTLGVAQALSVAL
ncbi:helix-turn-helix transcriptional regulator [Novosphingobium sp. RD2P27]|uniref:Helix-turn-helix transcriptional regulator n=1 Tax=Novosphingobium kalidii TaxID=3230299 RepID=A0ABV2D008_9SPHN